MKRLVIFLAAACWLQSTFAATSHSRASARRKATSRSTHWRSPTFSDPTLGDNVDGDDLEVRRAAVEALGRLNGTVVVADPETGRILTIVNQKLAYTGGFQPCSTIKLVTAFAALEEGLVDPGAQVRISRYLRLNLTTALAHSNNQYFGNLGQKLGFERIVHYAHEFGLGERAALNIEAEQPGTVPEILPQNGGAWMMTSFGEGFSVTPLELAGLLCAISNGGTLYYLQYPRNMAEIESFEPRVKRRLRIAPYIPDVKSGMRAAVEFGTARRANYDETEPVLGKTGTCTDYKAYSHMGWFGSFNDVGRHRLVVVVMLTGGHSLSGPVAAGVAGAVYKNLSEQHFFAASDLFATQSCCAR